MWLFTTFGFFSIVQKPGEKQLTIRARVAADLDALRTRYLPELGPTQTGGGTDYPYRARASRTAVMAAMSRTAEAVTYPNFKSRVAQEQGEDRAHAYSDVWSVLRRFGEQPRGQGGREVRTSASSPLQVGWLGPDIPVGLTLAPGVHAKSSEDFQWERDLDADLDRLCQVEHTTALVCLLEDQELVEYQIEQLEPKAKARGLKVLRFPIKDVAVPRSIEAVDHLLEDMDALEANDGRIVIHCRGGLGRSGTIGGCYLMRRGYSPDEALAMLVKARGPRCPETPTQKAFIRDYAKHVAARPAAPKPNRKRGKAPKTEQPSTTAASWYATSFAGFEEAEQAVCAAPQGIGAEKLLHQIEAEVKAAPDRCFSFADDGMATLSAAGRTFCAGKFSTPTIGELRARVAKRKRAAAGRLVLSVLQGKHPLTDIGSQQATAAPNSLFQVASQFNCLEAMGPHVATVSSYREDDTQGPHAAVSAFPGTFLRHYCAPGPGGKRFVQTDARCLNLLADVFGPSVAEICSGYLLPGRIHDPAALAKALIEGFEQARVGVHAGVEVVFGHDWDGPVPRPNPRIAQVFTAAMALGYGHGDGSQALTTACSQILRVAYVGTLLAGLDLGCETIVLTLIGGGVFRNPSRLIWDAIHEALAEVEPLASGTLQVLVNSWGKVAPEDRAKVYARGGAIVDFAAKPISVSRG